MRCRSRSRTCGAIRSSKPGTPTGPPGATRPCVLSSSVARAIPSCCATPTRRGPPASRSERQDPLDERGAVLRARLVGRVLLRVPQLGDEDLLRVGLSLVLL